jgi:NodT family efflux transporter outer membrane factor (OMF) lipoprotein
VARWSSSLAGGEADGPPDLAAWWTNFKDTNLDSFMATAVRSNLTLMAAESHVRESRAERDVVGGSLWPSVGSSASYSRNRLGPPGFPPFPFLPRNHSYYQAGFDATWELDVFGGIRRRIESADAEIQVAENDQRGVLISLLAEVARDYIGARGYQQRLAITRDNIRAQQDVLDLTSNRFQSGLSSDLDVQQATAILTSTEAQVPSLETGFRQNVYALSVLLAQPPGASLDDMSVAKPIPMTPPMVPVGLPSDLLQRRPDVRRAERELAAATARIGVAKADLFPKFSLTGFGGFENLSADHWFDAASRYWSAGPTVQWELFEAGSIRANIRVYNAREEQALDNYQQIVLVALEEVEDTLIAYAREQVRRGSLLNSVAANQQALEISTQLYKSGLADFLQVLDAERSLYESQDALVQSEQTVSLDLVQLYKALGGGWQAETNAVPAAANQGAQAKAFLAGANQAGEAGLDLGR